jgi:hypothetical protein
MLQPGGVALRRPKIQWTAEEKRRWLAELARAIDEAQQIVRRLAVQRGDNPRTSEVYGQLEAARDEVHRLQRGADRQAKLELHRDWSNLIAGVAACAGAVD